MGLIKSDVEGENPTPGSTVPESALVCQGVNNRSYVCDTGHCCGEAQCCSYYYELWWFWLVWTLIILLTCCCVCQHRRSKQRFQQQRRQNEINLIAYREARNNTQLPLYLRFLPDYLLPTYEEVADIPVMPPPPYSSLQHLGPPPDTPHHPLTPPCLAGDEDEDEEEEEEEEEEGVASSPTGADPLLGGTAPADDPLQTQSQVGPGFSGGGGVGGPGTQRDPSPGTRYRRFTGDSGIEVCDGQDLWDQHGFLGREEQEEEEEEEDEEEEKEKVEEDEEEEEGDVKEEIPACDSCSARAVAQSPETGQDRGTHPRALR